MQQFTAKKFNIPTLKGISTKNIEEHLKLYEGYVKNSNIIMEKVAELMNDPEKNAYMLGELRRRLSFEYNGMRNHEVYFSAFEGGPQTLKDGEFKKMIEGCWQSLDSLVMNIKHAAATTRGIGWAVLWYDRKENKLLVSWVDEQHLGQLNDCAMILALDMWEHSYVADYQPSGKKQYIEDFFANLNWDIVEENFKKADR